MFDLDVDRLAPAARRIRFETERMVAPLADDLPDPLADAVEIASYVFCADRLAKRSADHSPDIGEGWQRRLLFHIPVRCPKLWNSRDIKGLLLEALCFLSGDAIEFQFVQTTKPWSGNGHLGLNDQQAQRIRPDRAILFSGGLDSLAGVAESVIGTGERALLITHRSALGIAQRQDELAKSIDARAGRGKVLYLPVRVGRGKTEPAEFSQRLRSFLFATLGIAYAWMFNIRTLHFYENGITSFNLPLVGAVVGTRASRTTHPRVLRLFSKLFSRLMNAPIAFENPFIWKTKADVVRTIAGNGCGDLVGQTTSCASVRKMHMTGTQCGCCSQCVERRYAVLAAGLHEAPSAYKSDLFTDPHNDARDLVLIQAHLHRAQKLSTMSRHSFLANFGEVFRAVSDLPISPGAAAERIYKLHQRHGEEVVGVFDRQSALHSGLDALAGLPATSLLALVRSTQALPAYVDLAESEGTIVAHAADGKQKSTRFVLAIDHAAKQVVFNQGLRLSGGVFRLVRRLVDWRLETLTESTDGQGYRSATKLAEDMKIGDVTLRKKVSRAREELRDAFAPLGHLLDDNDIIQNEPWSGYRLNPHVVVVDLRQCLAADANVPVSQLPSRSVTTFAKSPTNSRHARG